MPSRGDNHELRRAPFEIIVTNEQQDLPLASGLSSDRRDARPGIASLGAEIDRRSVRELLELDDERQAVPAKPGDLSLAHGGVRSADDREARDDALLRAYPPMLVDLARLEACNARAPRRS